MNRWELNEEATAASGYVTETLASEARDALANVTDLSNGTCVVSVSLHTALAPEAARDLGSALLSAHEDQAVPA